LSVASDFDDALAGISFLGSKVWKSLSNRDAIDLTR
jgi:hypothetical protein